MLFAVAEQPRPCPLPFLDTPRPAAGFPSPAQDYIEGQLDLNEHLIERPAATFIVKISGDSLKLAGIHNGDLAIVDRSISARTGHIVVAVMYGELLVKRLRRMAGKVWLDPDTDDHRYQPIEVPEDCGFEIWGVVKNTIRDHLE
jgi:DNA polymerase V